MPDPNSNTSLQTTNAGEAMVEPNEFDLDAAAAVCLALIHNPSRQTVPADAWRSLARQNASLLSAPKETIRNSLARQASLLEAAMVSYTSRAALATKPAHAQTLNQIALGCNRALLSVLSAIHVLAEGERNDGTIPQESHD